MILQGLVAGKASHLSEVLLNGNELTGQEIVDLIALLPSRTGSPGIKVDLSCNNFGSLCTSLEKIESIHLILEYDATV